jgi:hypothetical protein
MRAVSLGGFQSPELPRSVELFQVQAVSPANTEPLQSRAPVSEQEPSRGVLGDARVPRKCAIRRASQASLSSFKRRDRGAFYVFEAGPPLTDVVGCGLARMDRSEMPARDGPTP